MVLKHSAYIIYATRMYELQIIEKDIIFKWNNTE